jgi:AcrR family transcriptional regulator
MHDQSSSTARDQITAAALRLIGDADAGDLLRALTPERIAAASDRSASTVRYHFGGEDTGGGTYAFQRRDLALAILAASLRERLDAARRSSIALVRAAEDVPSRGDLDGVHEAIGEALLPFLPGPSGAVAAAGERVHHLGLSICDTDAAAARMLRDARVAQVDLSREFFAALLVATGREMAPERSLAELGDAVVALLEGHLQRLRFDPGAPSAGVHAAITAIVATFSRRIGHDGFDADAAILAG